MVLTGLCDVHRVLTVRVRSSAAYHRYSSKLQHTLSARQHIPAFTATQTSTSSQLPSNSQVESYTLDTVGRTFFYTLQQKSALWVVFSRPGVFVFFFLIFVSPLYEQQKLAYKHLTVALHIYTYIHKTYRSIVHFFLSSLDCIHLFFCKLHRDLFGFILVFIYFKSDVVTVSAATASAVFLCIISVYCVCTWPSCSDLCICTALRPNVCTLILRSTLTELSLFCR